MKRFSMVMGVLLTVAVVVQADPAPEQGSQETTPNQRRALEAQNAASAAPAAATAPGVAAPRVEKLVFATAISEREPEGAAIEFSASVRQVYCWTKLSSAQALIRVKHVWSLNGEKVAEIPLVMNVSEGRTWSTKTIQPGSWTVDVLSEAGAVLSSGTFTVK